MGSSKVKILKDTFLNVFLNKKYKLSYIIETADWSIKSDGEYITHSLNKQKLIKSRTTFLKEDKFRKCHKSNKLVLTWFHVLPNDKRNKLIKSIQNNLKIIHTSCNFTKNKLIELGVNSEKIIVIPLGVDLQLFKPSLLKEKNNTKKKLNIPLNKVIIGSFLYSFSRTR